MLRTEIHRDAFEQIVVEEGDKRPYTAQDLRLRQSKKATIVFTLGLRVSCCMSTIAPSKHAKMFCSSRGVAPATALFRLLEYRSVACGCFIRPITHWIVLLCAVLYYAVRAFERLGTSLPF